jgi:hypothetical protein
VELGPNGAIPDSVVRDLELLRQRLTEMGPDDLPLEQGALLRQEISSIRLHLKRLEEERRWAEDGARRALDDY